MSTRETTVPFHQAESPGWMHMPGRYATVHAPEGSFASRRASLTLRNAERAAQILEKLLEIRKDLPGRSEPLDLYLVDALPGTSDREEASRVLPDGGILYMVSPDVSGEPLAHLVTKALIEKWFGTVTLLPDFLITGIAGLVEAQMEGATFSTVHTRVREHMEAGESLHIFQASPDGAATASFTAYLLERYGGTALSKFLRRYNPERVNDSALLAFNSSLGALEEGWLAFLRRTVGKGSELVRFVRELIPLLRPFWIREAEIMGYTFLALAYSLAMPLASKFLVDTIIPSGEVRSLALFIVIMLVLYLLNLVAGMRREYTTTWVNTQVLMGLQKRMFAHLQRLSHNYYSLAKVGDIMIRLSNDLQVVQGAMISIVNSGLYMVLSALGAAIALVFLSAPLAALVLLTLPMFAAAYFALRRRLQDASYARQQLSGEMASFVQENLLAHAVNKAFGLEGRAEETFAARLAQLFKATLRLVLIDSLFDGSTSLAVALGQLTVLGGGGYMVMEGNLTVGSLLAFFGFLPSLYAPVAGLAGLGQTVEAASGSLGRVKELLNEPVAVQDLPRAIPLAPLAVQITLQNVTFGYDAGSTVLQGVNISISAGSHVAIVGRSGAGKSTLAALLMRFYDPEKGSVLFDGQDVRQVTLASLRGQIATVFQETFVFDATVRDNISIGRAGATDAQVKAAARAARLDAYIGSLPSGYDTMLGERGVRMSGGQRQRLAIARALIRHPRVLILDEATSSLDPHTEREILDTLLAASQGRTVVSITHRLALAAKADMIFVLDAGRIMEGGTHSDLLAKDGLYRSMYDEQMGAAAARADSTGEGTRAVLPEGAEMLAQVPLFAGLDRHEQQTLARLMARERFSEEENVVRQGEPGDRFYVIRSGRVEVLAGGEDGRTHRVNILREGDYFGEMALFTGEPRSATVRTITPTEMYSLSVEDLKAVLEAHKDIESALGRTIQRRREALQALFST